MKRAKKKLTGCLSIREEQPVSFETSGITLPAFSAIDFVVDAKANEYIKEAQKQGFFFSFGLRIQHDVNGKYSGPSNNKKASQLIRETQLNVYTFDGYGGTALKAAKLSPDAAIQMNLQLAYHATHGQCTPTYETASTRQFQHGRTETIRTLSTDVKSLCDQWQTASVLFFSLLKNI